MKTYDKIRIMQILNGVYTNDARVDHFFDDKVPGSKWQNPSTGEFIEITDLGGGNLKFYLYDKSGKLVPQEPNGTGSKLREISRSTLKKFFSRFSKRIK